MPTDLRRLRQERQQLLMPNVALLDQDGRALRFYDHVMRGRKVLLNVMYSTCSNVCPPATANLSMAQALLGEQGQALHFVSLTLTPLQDPPAALLAYKKRHGLSASWTFLTGLPQHMETVLRALRLWGDEDDDRDLLAHAASARYVDEPGLRFTHVNALLPPRSIARSIRMAMA